MFMSPGVVLPANLTLSLKTVEIRCCLETSMPTIPHGSPGQWPGGRRIATGCRLKAAVSHLGAEHVVLPLRVHLELCFREFYASALQPMHPSHLILTSPPDPRPLADQLIFIPSVGPLPLRLPPGHFFSLPFFIFHFIRRSAPPPLLWVFLPRCSPPLWVFSPLGLPVSLDWEPPTPPGFTSIDLAQCPDMATRPWRQQPRQSGALSQETGALSQGEWST